MILAIDPGEDTGWVLFHTELFGMLDYGVCKLWQDLNIRIGLCDLVVCEDYRLYAFKAEAQSWTRPASVEVIGVVRYLCEILEKPLVFQGASQRTFFGSDRKPKLHAAGNKRLKDMGFWLSSKHSRDAMRHCLTYLHSLKHPQLLARIDQITP